MKIRKCFVSNSSSSSFVVISDNNIKRLDIYKNKDFIVDCSIGECEFGWQIEKYYDFDSKVNWAFITSNSLNNKYDDMLIKVLKDNLNCNDVIVELEYNKYDDVNFAYIDHGSLPDNFNKNDKIFESEETLKNFLFSDDSYIRNCNDNDPISY